MNSLEKTLQVAILEAADEVVPGSIPALRLDEQPSPRYSTTPRRPGRRLSRLLTPLAAAASVVAVTATLVVVNGLASHKTGPAGPSHPHRLGHQTARPIPATPPPPYYVTLTGITYPWYDHPLDATIRATASGRALATITPPAPYGTFSAVAGALTDRTYVLGAQAWQPQSNSAYVDNNSMASVRFFLLRVGPTGTTFQLTPLPMTDVTAPAQEESAALSPDGTRLAIAVAVPGSAGHAASQQIRVYDLTSSTARTWSATGPVAARATIGVLSWADDDQTVAFNWWGPTSGVRLLRTDRAGNDLLADSQPVPSGAGTGVRCEGDALLTPDGTTIVCPASTLAASRRRPATHSAAAARRLATARLRKVTDGPPALRTPFRQGYGEFSATTGKLLRVLGWFQYGHQPINDNGSPLLLWTSPSGGTLIVQDFYSNPLVAIVTQHKYEPIPWSGRISAGQGSVSEAAW
jgi:hypothetical protein